MRRARLGGEGHIGRSEADCVGQPRSQPSCVSEVNMW